MTSAAVAIPYKHKVYSKLHSIHKEEEDLIEKWKKILNKTKWKNIIELNVEEAKEPIRALMSFIESHNNFFSINVEPVTSDLIEEHLKPHYTQINRFVHDNVLAPREAVKLAEHIYLYDSVLPHLSITNVRLRDSDLEELKIKILMIPDPLYDWMFKLDYVWEKLLIKERLDRDLFSYLETNKIEFVHKARNLKAFLPIPTKELPEKTPDIERMWFRRYNVGWESVHAYLYKKVSDSFLMNVI